jgi:hypothetical protein
METHKQSNPIKRGNSINAGEDTTTNEMNETAHFQEQPQPTRQEETRSFVRNLENTRKRLVPILIDIDH